MSTELKPSKHARKDHWLYRLPDMQSTVDCNPAIQYRLEGWEEFYDEIDIFNEMHGDKGIRLFTHALLPGSCFLVLRGPDYALYHIGRVNYRGKPNPSICCDLRNAPAEHRHICVHKWRDAWATDWAAVIDEGTRGCLYPDVLGIVSEYM